MVFRRIPLSRRAARLGLGASLFCAAFLASGRASAQSTDAPSSGAPAQAGTTSPRGDALIPQDAAAAQVGTPQPDPTKDQQKLLDQGRERPVNDGLVGERPTEVFSEDWWSHTRPIVELHGYFRTRGELFHNFALGRHGDEPNLPQGLWPQPIDHSYADLQANRHDVQLCNDPSQQNTFGTCIDKSQATANLRLRLNPEIHISDNLRVLTQIDLLDNLVLGSTPESYAARPTNPSTYGFNGYNGNAPLGFFSATNGPPTAGVNGYRNSIDVKRAWAEYLTPLGQLRFGRMPHQWGLGMVANAGDGLDSDYQSTIDRIMFVSGIKSADLYFGGSWDFISSGPTSAGPYDVYGGQPYNLGNLTNVDEWSAFVAKRTNPELQRLKLSRNDAVLNGGLYTTYRKQLLDVKAGSTPLSTDLTTTNNGLERRGAQMVVPDVWLQFLWNKLRIEAEAASMWGSIEGSPDSVNYKDPTKIRMWGLATQAEMKAVEDKLRVQFGAGWASGDPNVEGLGTTDNGFRKRLTGGAMSTFAFSPAYYVDYIFFRRILSRVEGAYYFRPSVEYDFLRNPNGQKFGGGAAIIWSRASEFVQTPGNKRDLGVELDIQLYYQSKDGTLNDDPNKMGGFYAGLQYGVFFPLGGLEYTPGVQGTLQGSTPKLVTGYDLSTAQTVRLILGVMF